MLWPYLTYLTFIYVFLSFIIKCDYVFLNFLGCISMGFNLLKWYFNALVFYILFVVDKELREMVITFLLSISGGLEW